MHYAFTVIILQINKINVENTVIKLTLKEMQVC